MVKSYMVVLFIAFFMFSFSGEAKLLTTKQVAAKKLEKKTAAVEKTKISKKKNQTVSTKPKTNLKPARKVVRLDFDQPAPQMRQKKQKQEAKSVAKVEAPKKTFKSISCHNGFIVGEKAYCSTAKSAIKKGRSVASVSKQGKKLK